MRPSAACSEATIATGAVWWYVRPPDPAALPPAYSPISPRSRYHDRGRRTRRSQARSEIVNGASPGATPRHFCVPE